ncbi:MAG TPA: flagellar basal body L-ring protein FlgH [Candidatus Aquabacterium excrementipullorum]|nr:flagellar basal body L-ring protein FlgH [Candidatus Aquabacterium excrementipullorum]
MKFQPAIQSRLWLAGTCAITLAGCGTPPSIVQAPVSVTPNQPAGYVERINNGAIFQASLSSGSLFTTDRRPRNVGDTLKIDISETLTANSTLDTKTSRENEVASVGPGGSGSGSSFIDRLMNMNAKASGSDSFKGSGATTNSSKFEAQLAASVINVLPNGNLVVAGERSILLNGNMSTLRFSGVVNPRDIKSNNVVASADIVDARFEVGGKGDVPESVSRTWLQRFLTNTLSVW